ncbi:MAG TPA: MarR family winged helix-turn-helix transcriptional regulator [Limnochordia bacterium]|jgi:Transcriptional regulators|nr:MarR family winged helix-turn-helix transcriptional regulator [Limnochordia bacterium]
MPSTPLEISLLWRHVNREMRGLLHRAGREFEMPPFSFMLLRHIKEEPGITLSELARRVGAAKSHTSTTIEQLVQEGYVEKRADPSDQRVLRLHATEAAMRMFARMGDRAQGVWAIVLEEFEGDTDEVARFLKALLTALERANARMERETTGVSSP